jgi:hypothetical protein
MLEVKLRDKDPVLLELDDVLADSVVVTDALELELRDNVAVKLGLAYTVVL